MKTNKAQTLRQLEEEASASLDVDTFKEVVTNRTQTAVFIDFMACVQKLSSRAGISTFGDLLAGLEKFIRLGFLEGNIVQVVSDRYDSTLSIKAGERKRRGHTANSPEVCIYS